MPPVQKITTTRNSVLRQAAQNNLWNFVELFWSAVPGSQPLEPAKGSWHMHVICQELQEIAERVFRGEPKKHNLLINCPPGVSKSSLCSILFPAWTWTRMPGARHITASHTDMLVLDLATKSRAVIESDLYKELFPEIKLRDDQTAKGYFANTLGGDRVSCTVGGKSPMGFHGHFLSLDDPINPQQVLSAAELENAAQFAPRVLFTRKVDKKVSVFIGIMQRLHVGDPSGVLLEKAKEEGSEALRHINLPAELTDKVSPPELAEKYQDGLLDPVRLSHEALKPFKTNRHEYNSQFLQEPFLLGGGLFKVQYFNNRCKAAPYNCTRIRFYDRASGTNTSSCFTAGALLAKDAEGRIYIEHLVHGQWEPDERNQIILATAHRDRTKYGPLYEPRIYIEAEGGSSGRDAWKGIARLLAGFPVYEERVTGAKDVRAEPWSCFLASGNGWIVESGDWDINKLISEHLRFLPEPGKKLGRFKDIVDSCTGAFNLLVQQKIMGGITIHNFRKPKQKTIQVVVLSKQQLASTTFQDEPALLLTIQDPLSSPEECSHGIAKLLDRKQLEIANLDPEHFQETWQEPVEGYDLPPNELIMSRDTGKQLWGFLTKKRDPTPKLVVICDEDTDRGLAIAYGVTDTLRLPRKETIQVLGHVDTSPVWEKGSPNKYLTQMVKLVKDYRETVV